ncbi:MAG TPA: LacI family DNA-binding transcriptional regulator [Gaiellaceae bacterium]|jgi:DNA-binding LacI/PurR family transcriptional regulator|nr:LacI family DNA-binding transcriptional regulator [Gaiellaceae bacterium]
MESLPESPATITDVAARAGVGVGTVSRVLNGRSNVRPVTRAKVLEAIEALKYRPSPLARNLSLRRTHVIGVVVPFFTSHSAVERVRGVATALARSAYDLMLFDIESEERREHAFQLFDRGDRSDGLLMISLIPPDDEVERLRSARLPCVLVDAPHPELPSIVIDDVRGGELATAHLIELGHRRIGYLGDKSPDPFRFASSRDRTRGYERALAAAGLEVRREYVREGTQSHHVARSTAIDLLRLPKRPTAVFAASDTQALGVLEAARILGLRVPQDLSVVGFDDIEIAAHIGLTTVRQPLFESGRRGAELLLLLLSGTAEQPAHAHSEQLSVELVVRSTTAAPPG